MVKEGQIQEALVMYQKALDLNDKLHGPERYSSNIFILYVWGLIARLQQTDIIVIINLLSCFFMIYSLSGKVFLIHNPCRKSRA